MGRMRQQKNEAPPSMSWRGLIPATSRRPPIARLPGVPQPAVSLTACRLLGCLVLTAHRFCWTVPRKCQLPGFPRAPGFPLPAQEFPPQKTSAPAVREFLLRWPALHKGLPSTFSRFFDCPHDIHRNPVLVPRVGVAVHHGVHSLVHRTWRTAGRSRWPGLSRAGHVGPVSAGRVTLARSPPGGSRWPGLRRVAG